MTQVPPNYPPNQVPVPPPGGSLQPHRGTMILVFGILGCVCCVVFAILAWVFGSGDLKKIRAGQMDPAGEGLTKAGMILGIVGVCLSALMLILNVAGVFRFNFHPYVR